jgi:cytochrome P450
MPIIGNLPDIPDHHSWLKFKEWSDKYGPIFRLNLAGQQHVVLSTEKIANDLLRERGSKYSSRPYLPMAQGILSRNMRPVFLPYNDLWRNGRRLMHRLTMNAVAVTYEPVQDAYSKRYLRELLHDPSSYQRWFELFSAAVVFKLAFDKTIVTGDEHEIKRIVNVVHTLEKVASPGTYLVDIFPSLMYLPRFLASFKRQGDQWHKEEVGLFRQLQNDVRKDMAGGFARNSFTRTFLEGREEYKLSDDEGAYVVGTMFEAGSGTTAAALMSFVLAMSLHPEWQDKMQKEIDEHVGERMPEFEDIPNLPTVRAVIKEVMRWRPVTAGGLPHMLIEDDIYDGYFFKAGTVFHPNQWYFRHFLFEIRFV